MHLCRHLHILPDFVVQVVHACIGGAHQGHHVNEPRAALIQVVKDLAEALELQLLEQVL